VEQRDPGLLIMRDFKGKLGVITGAGTGMGRELARQLVADGCHVAICDIVEQNLDDTISLCQEENPGAEVSGIVCDVADESQILRFREHVRETHGTEHINLLVNNAGISGGGSFIESAREEWERTFDICWSGVYLMTRAFMPMLIKSTEGHIVNVSSANALRAVLGGHIPHTAYSSAKFAVRGFSEALIHDFRFNAPHLKVSVVMPGHVGTEIMTNSAQILGQHQPRDWTDEDIRKARARWEISGLVDHSAMDDDQVRAAGEKEIQDMRILGLSPAEAARIILEGVRSGTWRILVGTDAQSLDALVRESPDTAYDPDFVVRWREANRLLVEASQNQSSLPG
jgi:NAD(P)-dependent dehydrogenase (short-subunit alcohol dehydrogenase family)